MQSVGDFFANILRYLAASDLYVGGRWFQGKTEGSLLPSSSIFELAVHLRSSVKRPASSFGGKSSVNERKHRFLISSPCVWVCVCGLLELQFQSAVSLRESCHHIADCFRLFLSTFVSPLFFLLNGRTLSDGFRNPDMTEYFCHVSARRQCCHWLVTMCCKWTLKRNMFCSQPFRPELRIRNF